MSNKSYVIAVSMMPHGIKMAVKSTTDFVDGIIDELGQLATSDRQKAMEYELKLKNKLLREDAFFNKHPKEALIQKQRWSNFCDLCIDYAALKVVLYQEPIYLVHPDQYDEGRSKSLIDLSSQGAIDLIPNVSVMKMAA